MVWPEPPRYRCGVAGCPANNRRGVQVEGAARADLAAAKAALNAHHAAKHNEPFEEEVDGAAELLVA